MKNIWRILLLALATGLIGCAEECSKTDSKPLVVTMVEKPSSWKEADRLGIWFPASDFDPLGLHLAPGDSINIDVKRIKGNTPPKLLVGTYSRYKSDDVPTVYDLKDGNNKISDPKGGLLYLQYVTEDDPSGEVEVSIDGGKPIPSYVLGESTHEEWLKILEDTMSYEDVQFISNRTFVIVSKATALKYKDQNQDSMLMILDKVSDVEDYISGIDGSTERNKPNVHKLLITELTEKDLDFGLAAEEHRVMIPTAACDNIMLPARASSDAWGLWHEVGHHRQAVNWDWPRVDEVTVNIYSLASLYAFDSDFKWLKGKAVWDDVAKYLESPIEERDFNKDKTIKGNGRLAMFRQLWMAYGDAFYIKLHQIAREDNAKPNPRVTPREMSAVEQMMSNFMFFGSQACGNNLKNFFKAWGFKLPQKYFDELDALGLPDPTIDLLLLRE